MTEIIGTVGRQQFPQEFFDLNGILALVKTEPTGQADTMGIHHNSGLPEDVSDDQIGGFASDTGQACESFDRIRYDAVVFVPQHLTHSDNIPCFGLV